MKRRESFLVLGVSVVLLSSSFARAQCPEDTVDRGECDTLHLTCFECVLDSVTGPPYLVQFPLLVTNDLTVPEDSIFSFTIPLAYTATNPSAYCSVSWFWNNTYLYPFPDILTRHSIFHHITDPVTGDTLVRNRMMSMSEALLGLDWDTNILDLDGTSRFWLAMFPTGSQDQGWWEADRALLATMTFRVEDTMQVCIDTTFWPPASRLCFIRRDGWGYFPRHNLPGCFSICYFRLGDCNADGVVDVSDVLYLINYLFLGGLAPVHQGGDVNCDGRTDASDVVFLINYLFRGGPEPSC